MYNSLSSPDYLYSFLHLRLSVTIAKSVIIAIVLWVFYSVS